MCTEHRADGASPARQPRPTRRRFLAGGAGALTAAFAVPLLGTGVAGAHETAGDPVDDGSGNEDTVDDGSGEAAGEVAEATDGAGAQPAAEEPTIAVPSLLVPAYANRPGWGADEKLRLAKDGTTAYPVAFFPVQKITIHHTASWAPWSTDDAIALVKLVYEQHVQQGFGDVGYHLLIDPLGTVYEGRYSGGTQFPVYDTYPGEGVGPWAVNAAHAYNLNAGNIGIAMIGDFDETAVSDEAWSALVSTVAMICANTGLDPQGESLYANPITGRQATLPNVLAHQTVAGTHCPGWAIVERFDELRQTAAALVAQMAAGTWLA